MVADFQLKRFFKVAFMPFIFRKVVRRCRWFFVYLKHCALFLLGVRRCCFFSLYKDHKDVDIEIFSKKLALVLDKLKDRIIFFSDKNGLLRLQNITEKILDGNFWIFESYFVKQKGAFSDWSEACDKACRLNCSKILSTHSFCWNVWRVWNSRSGRLRPDMRVVWEKGRLQHLMPVLLSGWGRRKKRESFVREQIFYFVENNRFLHGPNWTCAMEVAIRAVNILWAIAFLSRDSFFDLKVSQILCQHAQFIWDCWEDFDKPNNHLVADLVGMAYLSVFFGWNDLFDWSLKELYRQFGLQILSDGSCWEGSVGYHRLMCEMLCHVVALAQVCGKVVPQSILELQRKALSFLDFCTQGSELKISIGDNDSSKFVFGIVGKQWKVVQRKFQSFGLSIISGADSLCAMKLPVFDLSRPSGHVHRDWLSLTLTLAGQPILVDPGSAFYTKHRRLRDFMRSGCAHSTIYCPDWDMDLKFHDLFYLSESGQPREAKFFRAGFEKQGVKIFRKFKPFFNKSELTGLEVIDNIYSVANLELVSNWILGPQMKPKKKKNGFWVLCCDTGKSFILRSDLDLKIKRSFFAPNYFKLENTSRLSGRINVKAARLYTFVTKIHTCHT